MSGKYKAAFIIPIGARRNLCEDGWEFETSSRISPEVSKYLIKTLKLKLLESYLGLDDYVGENMKMSVVHDEQNNIESIYFQLYEDALTALSKVCQSEKLTADVELFVPQQGQGS